VPVNHSDIALAASRLFQVLPTRAYCLGPTDSGSDALTPLLPDCRHVRRRSTHRGHEDPATCSRQQVAATSSGSWRRDRGR
jgi:hypothetical protein